MANENKQTVVNAIWNDPRPAFGGEWVKRRNVWQTPKGEIRLLLNRTGQNITVAGNTGSGFAGQTPDVFTYLQQYRLNTAGFAETLKAVADLYGLNLSYTPEERGKMKRGELARELAPSFVEALKQHPDGETARYLRDRRRFNIDAHFGELTPETLNAALEHLNNRGIAYDPADVRALGLTEARAKAGYCLLIPYTVNGSVQGFLLRNVRANHNGPKYLFSDGLGRGGYCDTLEFGKPVVVVEGPLDAVRLTQSGVKNVVGMGGAKIGEEIGRLLRGRNITEVVYIPDNETDEHGQRKTKLVADAIRAFQSVQVDGEPVVKSLFVADLPTPEGPNGKNDADSYGAEHPDELAALVELGAVDWWRWELSDLIRRGIAQEEQGGTVAVAAFQDGFNEIYTRCRSPYERERIRQHVANDTTANIYRAYGITPQSLNDVDEWNRGREYNNRVRAAAADLARAVEDQANPETVGAIVQRLNDAQGANTRSEWEVQLAETFDDELAAIREQPETLRTRWEVGNVDKAGKYHRYERIEFYPADIAVFCAPTSHGKTMVLFQAAFDLVAAYPSKTFLFVSCEENKRQLVERALNVYITTPTTPTGKDTRNNAYCFIQGTRKRTIRAAIRNTAAPDEYGGLLGVSEHFDALKRDINNRVEAYRANIWPRLKFVHTEASTESICNNILHYIEQSQTAGVEVGGVFVDYMQLLTSEARNFSRHDELKDICKALKDLAARTELPVIIAAQLNRDVLRPVSGFGSGFDNITVANIGEGADIERVAHDVYLVWQVDKTPLAQYYKTGEDGKQAINLKAVGPRSRRLFEPDEFGIPSDLKTGYFYIEQLKARDGKPNGWGLFPFDGERGKIGEIDTAQMAKQCD